MGQEEVIEINRVLRKYSIADNTQIKHFLAQIFHESATGLLEDGDFSHRDLHSYNNASNWDDPRSKARKGDGNLYRGAGYLQLTWKVNYHKFAVQMKSDAGINGAAVFTSIMIGGADTIRKDYAWESAGWIWTNDITGYGSPQQVFEEAVRSNLGAEETVRKITLTINGGYNGLADRYKYFGIISTVI